MFIFLFGSTGFKSMLLKVYQDQKQNSNTFIRFPVHKKTLALSADTIIIKALGMNSGPEYKNISVGPPSPKKNGFCSEKEVDF